LALLPLALTQIQRGLAIPAEELGTISAIIRLGAAPAFLFALSADHFGRRRVLLLAITAYLLLTGLTALALTPFFFMLTQFGVRLFAAVAGILALVMIIEEFPNEARGWGIGVYTALASVGGGSAALLFAFVDVIPLGWRALFLVVLPALLLVGLWRTYLPETTRFQQQQTNHPSTHGLRAWITPLATLASAYPGRFVLVGLVVLLFNLGGDAALFYDPTYLQQQHGWRPWQIAALNLGAGFMALVGSVVAGRASDRGANGQPARFCWGCPSSSSPTTRLTAGVCRSFGAGCFSPALAPL
jgi:putative MFS transporter